MTSTRRLSSGDQLCLSARIATCTGSAGQQTDWHRLICELPYARSQCDEERTASCWCSLCCFACLPLEKFLKKISKSPCIPRFTRWSTPKKLFYFPKSTSFV